jgi:hypothetical protein
MSIRTSVVAAMICLGFTVVHCGGGQPAEASHPKPAPVGATVEPPNTTSTPEPPFSAPEETPPPVTQTPCPSPGDADEAKAHFEQAEKLLAESRDGDHYLAGPLGKSMALFRSAAAKGHLEAQYRYGSVKFSDMFQSEAPTAKQEEDYVRALTYLRLAALRGHEKAKSYIEGIATLTVDGAGKVSKPIPEPLNALPQPWLRRVIVESDALAGCP